MPLSVNIAGNTTTNMQKDRIKNLGAFATKGVMGKSAGAWKGDKAGYVAKHMWIISHYGKASKCEHCDSKTAKRYEWANISGNYEREVIDYKQLCPSCHRKWDFGSICGRGHFLTKDNTRITKEGWRSCRACHALRQREYYTKIKNKR